MNQLVQNNCIVYCVQIYIYENANRFALTTGPWRHIVCIARISDIHKKVKWKGRRQTVRCEIRLVCSGAEAISARNGAKETTPSPAHGVARVSVTTTADSTHHHFTHT